MPKEQRGMQRLPEPMSPFDELELMDLHVEHAAIDEDKRCFCPNTHPKPPDRMEEGVTSRDGSRTVDMMADTPPIDGLAAFDLGQDELRDLDPL